MLTTLSFLQNLLIGGGGVTSEYTASLLPNSDISVGGGYVASDLTTLHLYGHVHTLYEMDLSILVNKFTRLQFDLTEIIVSEQLRICIYEDEEDVAGQTLVVGDETRCTNITESGSVDIGIGDFFDDRVTQIKYISFIQDSGRNPRSGESEITNIVVEPGETVDVVDENGKCADSNANEVVPGVVGNAEGVQCVCDDGFVSSNGGKILGEYDSCVHCLSYPDCALDGETCSRNRDCMMGICIDSICVPGVSSNGITVFGFVIIF